MQNREARFDMAVIVCTAEKIHECSHGTMAPLLATFYDCTLSRGQ